jgi:hypothetical protein
MTTILFSVSVIVVGNFILLNLFLTVTLDGFDDIEDNE